MSSAISAAAGSAGSIAGAGSMENAAEQSGDAQKQASLEELALLQQIQAPTLSAPTLSQYSLAGTINPQQEANINASPSAAGGVTGNAQTSAAQMQALQQMQQYGAAGLTPAERAQLEQTNEQTQQANQANQTSITQDMAARGQGGSGAELAARLQNSQASANTASQNANAVSSMATQRALQAIGQSSQMANQLQGQQFGEQFSAAQAQDQLNRFNTQNQLAVQQQNVGATNQAQYANLANAQQTGNANVSQNNQNLYYANQMAQQNFQDQMSKATGQMGAIANYGNAAATQANQFNQAQAGLWSGLAGGGASYASSMGSGNQQPSDEDEEELYTGGTVKGYAFGGNISDSTLNMKYTGPQGTGPSGGGGGDMGDISSIAEMFAYKGGTVPCYDDGGEVDEDNDSDDQLNSSDLSFLQKLLNNNASNSSDDGSSYNPGGDALSAQKDFLKSNSNNISQAMAPKVNVPTMNNSNMKPGNSQVPANALNAYIQRPMNNSGFSFAQPNYAYGGAVQNYVNGGKVPGTPKVPGNNPINDVVRANVSPGEVVIPNSVMQSRDPVGGAAQFVASELAKKFNMKKYGVK